MLFELLSVSSQSALFSPREAEGTDTEVVDVVEVRSTTGGGALTHEPVTIATLRDHDGRSFEARIVGGRSTTGGWVHVAGYVVPFVGARVRRDLRASPTNPRNVDAAGSTTETGARPPTFPPLTGFVANTPAGTWPDAALPIPFVLNSVRSRDVGSEAVTELEVARRAWTNASCTKWRARIDGERPVTAGDDGINAVFFHDDAWPDELVAGAIAQTVIHTDDDGNYRDADIHLNGKDFRFSLDGRTGTVDLRSVFVHELGHALGLGHSADPRATMFASSSGVRWRSLERDDIDGVCALYPGAGEAGCTNVVCPEPFVCVADRCQRRFERADVCSPCERIAGACEAAGDDARCIDIGTGESAGRVCGRACGTDRDCGEGFSCASTTEAGDRQCVSVDGCQNGTSRCQTDAECTNSVCRAGACVAAIDETSDAGSDIFDGGSLDGSTPDGAAVTDESCTCATIGRGGSGGSEKGTLLVGLLLAFARAFRRRTELVPSTQPRRSTRR